MKTKFATIMAGIALVLTTANLTYADSGTYNGTFTELTHIGNINKIEASGNVDVYIVNGDKDAVRVFDDYYAQNSVVKNEDGVLRIASYTSDKLMVLVTVADLDAITANDNAFVKTYGDALSAKVLNVTINNNAVAVLQLDAIAANITVNNKAHAELYGNVDNFTLGYSTTATINKSLLKYISSRVSKIEQPKKAIRHYAALRSNNALLN